MYFWVEWRTPDVHNGFWQESESFDTLAYAFTEVNRLRAVYGDAGEYIVQTYDPGEYDEYIHC